MSWSLIIINRLNVNIICSLKSWFLHDFVVNLNKTLKIMLKKLPVQPQLEMFKTVLTSFIHPEHELCLLANKIDWKGLEDEFAPLYGKVGHPSVRIRTIVGLLLLKQMYNLGDETVVERYLENPY
jgi:transposase, IS5 family